MKTYLLRILPYFLAFLFIEACVRVQLAIAEWSNLDHGVFSLIQTMVMGLIPDIAAFLYIVPFLLVIQFFVPRRIDEKKSGRIVQGTLYAIFLLIMLFTAVSQWLFWEELTSRFNFIAVDYLVYMDEVVGNITESYNVGMTISSLVVVALLGGIAYSRYVTVSMNNRVGIKQKMGLLIGGILLCSCSFFAVSEDTSEVFDNNYENEISKNGIFSLFSAFKNNELSYDQFYTTNDKVDALTQLKGHLQADGYAFTDDGITRHISAAGKEIRPNIVLITVESLSADYLGVFGNTEELTPNLDKLSKIT